MRQTCETKYMIKYVWSTLQKKFGCKDTIDILSLGEEIELRQQVLMDAGIKNNKCILGTIFKNLKAESAAGCDAKTIFHPHVVENKLVIENHVIIPEDALFYITFTNPNRIEVFVYRTLLHEMGHCLCNHELFDQCESMSDVLTKRAHSIAQRISDTKQYHEKWPTTDGLTDEEILEMSCDYYKMITDERDANHRVGLSSIEMATLGRVYNGIPTNIINHITDIIDHAETDD